MDQKKLVQIEEQLFEYEGEDKIITSQELSDELDRLTIPSFVTRLEFPQWIGYWTGLKQENSLQSLVQQAQVSV
jgi:hypothetical protein